MRNWIWFVATAAIAASMGCGGSNENSNYLPMTRKNVTPENVDRATKSLGTGKGAKVLIGASDFGFRLFREAAKSSTIQNEFMSPLSVSTALAMAANGAVGGTKDAFDKVLGVENTLPNEINQAYRDMQTTLIGADPKVVVTIANGIWVDREFELKREFLARATDFYSAKAQAIEMSNPESLNAINEWVSQETESKIPKLFEKIEDGTKSVLVNAVYFHGKWTEPFDKSLTKDADFRSSDGKSKQIPFMNRQGEQFDYLASEKFAAVRLPYGDGRISMTVFLPHEKASLTSFLAEVSSKNFAAWQSKFKPIPGAVWIPKWKSEGSYDLKAPLAELGLGIAMDRSKADFGAMANVKAGDLFINQVVHKTVIEVDEEGTEAAGATGIGIGTTSAPMPTERFEFKANRPFAYAISDKQTGAVLFFGTFVKP